MLSESRATSSRRGDLVVLGTVNPTHRKSILMPSMRGRVSKIIMMEFTIVSNEIQKIVTRTSKLAGPRRRASQWRNWHRKTTTTAYPLRNMRDIGKLYLTDATSIRLPSRSTIMNRLHREPREERAEPVPFQQYRRWHPSSSNGSWWNWDTSKSWWSS